MKRERQGNTEKLESLIVTRHVRLREKPISSDFGYDSCLLNSSTDSPKAVLCLEKFLCPVLDVIGPQ